MHDQLARVTERARLTGDVRGITIALGLPFASPVSANDVAVVSSAKSGARVQEPQYGDLPRSAKHTLEAASLRQPSNGVEQGVHRRESSAPRAHGRF